MFDKEYDDKVFIQVIVVEIRLILLYFFKHVLNFYFKYLNLYYGSISVVLEQLSFGSDGMSKKED